MSNVYRFYCFQTTDQLSTFADWGGGGGGGWGVGVVVCEGHNCMIPDIKTYFDKKVAFLALMPVLSETVILAS